MGRGELEAYPWIFQNHPKNATHSGGSFSLDPALKTEHIWGGRRVEKPSYGFWEVAFGDKAPFFCLPHHLILGPRYLNRFSKENLIQMIFQKWKPILTKS